VENVDDARQPPADPPAPSGVPTAPLPLPTPPPTPQDTPTGDGSPGTAAPPASTTPARPQFGAAPPVAPHPRNAWGTRGVALVVGALAGIGGWFAATRFLPRWWAHRIGAVSDGTFTAGISAGLVCGIAFTLLPLLVLRGVARRGATWTTRFVLVVLAFLLAVPNLITLGIVLGTNDAAHAAERTFDVDAPGFRGATLAGAIVGGLLGAAFWVLLWRGRRRRQQIADLKGRLAERDERAKATDADREDG
jgi:hypothetical protein